MTDERLLTTREIAKYLGLSKSTIYKMVDLGILPCVRVGINIAAKRKHGGPMIRFQLAEVQKAMMITHGATEEII